MLSMSIYRRVCGAPMSAEYTNTYIAMYIECIERLNALALLCFEAVKKVFPFNVRVQV